MSRRLAPTLALSLLILWPAVPAGAHGLAGKRFFPSTIAIEDPFVSDELTLPSILHIKRPAPGDEPATRETEISGELSSASRSSSASRWRASWSTWIRTGRPA